MPNIFDNFLKQLGTGDTVKDFKHASRLMVTDNYRLSPKYTWLYHVFFDFSSTASYAKTKQLETGMLVRSVSLPRYTVDNKQLNSYNRKDIVQTKLRYPSIEIEFHDDSADVVRHFWFDYLTHYYRDTDLGYKSSSGSESGQVNPTYYRNSKYRPRVEGDEVFVPGLTEGATGLNDFGYTPRKTNQFSTAQYLNAIRVYSLHQKRFSEYTLINPIITSFQHDTHDSSANGSMRHRMTVDFTSVLYATGDVNPSTVVGFGDLHYDKSPSPLTPQGGGVESILGPGGFVNAIDTILSESGIGGDRGTDAAGIGSALFTAFRTFQNLETNNTDLKGLAETELAQTVKDILSGQDPRNTVFVPNNNSVEFNDAQTQIRLDNPTAQSSNPGSNNLVSNGTSLGALTDLFQSVTSPITGTPGFSAGFPFIESLSSSGGDIAGTTNLNQVLDLTKNPDGSTVSATDQSTTPVNSGFFGRIASVGQGLASDAQAFFSQQSRAASGTTKIVPQSLNDTTFTTGTNTVTNSINALKRTPFGNKIISSTGPNTAQDLQSMIDLASEQGQKFVETGNINDLVPPGFRINQDTNPEDTR
tara:strand:- start:864 stop:2621 length:1758 start_codon:yes stop_codon:yes gene_type:complete